MKQVTLPLLLIGFAFGGGTHQFSHFQHVKTEELECTDCHTKTMYSTTLAESRVGLTLKACEKCHADDSEFTTPKPIVLADPSFRIQRMDAGGLKFNHKAHISAKVQCTACHGDVLVPGDSVAALKIPNPLTMKSCMECHLQRAEISCLTCHDKIEKPVDHLSATWLRSQGHGMQSNLRDPDCALCHDKGQITTCDECHMGGDARKVHGPNYRFNHGIDVRFKKLDCSVCHAPLDQFCADCHEGKGR